MSVVTTPRRMHTADGREQQARPLLVFPRSPLPQSDDVLSSCHGYEVEAPEARLGVVQELRYGRRHDRPDLLVVRAGRLRRRTLLVPVDLVEQALPEQRRLVLRSAPAAEEARRRVRGSTGGLSRMVRFAS